MVSPFARGWRVQRIYWIYSCARAIVDDDMPVAHWPCCCCCCCRRRRQHVTVIPRAIYDPSSPSLGPRRRACQRSSTTIQPGAAPVVAAVGIQILASPRFVPFASSRCILNSPSIPDLIIPLSYLILARSLRRTHASLTFLRHQTSLSIVAL